MPFDGTGYEDCFEALEKIDKVIDLLGDERRWCKKQLQTLDGRRCVFGAMKAADATHLLKAPILLAIEQVTGHSYARIEHFNDHPATTHALVVGVLRQARENIDDSSQAAQQRIGTRALFRQVLFRRHSPSSAS